MTKKERLKLQIAACKVRMGMIESTHGAKAGHPGGSLSAADMFTYLYNKEMRVDPTNPKWENRDRFVLSKGHTAPGLYSALAYRGFFPVEDLPTLRHIDSYLQGHPKTIMDALAQDSAQSLFSLQDQNIMNALFPELQRSRQSGRAAANNYNIYIFHFTSLTFPVKI